MSEERAYYQTLVSTMPAGLQGAIVTVLARCNGRDKAMTGARMLDQLKIAGLDVKHVRQVQEAIRQLRRAGYLICAAPGEDGGYYLASDLDEYLEFEGREFNAKIADMSETRRIMHERATAEFGGQVRLF